jgi:hypothetical protein
LVVCRWSPITLRKISREETSSAYTVFNSKKYNSKRLNAD